MAQHSRLVPWTLGWYVVVLGLVLSTGWPASGAVEAPLTLPPAEAMEPTGSIERALLILQAAHSFTSARVGFAGRLTTEGQAWNTLLKSQYPAWNFRLLLERATTPAGELYALAGMNYTDHAAFRQQVWNYGSRQDSVRIMRGCVAQDLLVRHVLVQIAEGDWAEDLRVEASDWPIAVAGPIPEE